jgi:hypothetical protein
MDQCACRVVLYGVLDLLVRVGLALALRIDGLEPVAQRAVVEPDRLGRLLVAR